MLCHTACHGCMSRCCASLPSQLTARRCAIPSRQETGHSPVSAPLERYCLRRQPSEISGIVLRPEMSAIGPARNARGTETRFHFAVDSGQIFKQGVAIERCQSSRVKVDMTKRAGCGGSKLRETCATAQGPDAASPQGLHLRKRLQCCGMAECRGSAADQLTAQS